MKIVPKPYLSRKKLAITFFGIFGFIWLMIEPLPSLGVIPEFVEKNGKWIYWTMLFVSLIATFLIETSVRFLSSRKRNLVSVTIILTELGLSKNVEAPKDIRIDIFLGFLMKKLSKYSPKNSALLVHEMYDLTLVKKMNNNEIELDSNLTFKEAGIENGDSFKVKGIIKPIHTQILFSSAHTKEGRKQQSELVEQTKKEEEIFNSYIDVAKKIVDKNLLIEYFNCTEYKPEWETLGLPPLTDLAYLKKVIKKNGWANPIIYEKEF